MITFPTYEEKAKIGDIEFAICDLSVGFFDKVDKDNSLYNDREILKDASTLTDEQIEKVGTRAKVGIVNAILDLTNPDRHKELDDLEEVEEKK